MEKRTWKTEYTFAEHPQQLDNTDQELLKKAFEALEASHAPYSHFNVGAALLLSDGEIILGSNQENASYPIGLCAERTAISAKASLSPKTSIQTIAIRVRSRLKKVESPAAPCGICRQVLLESESMQDQPIRVMLQGESGPILIFESIQDLMPFHFGASDF